MEIENPQTAKFVPLPFAFNFEPDAVGASFYIDWTKGGEGEEILRELIRSKVIGRVRHANQLYQGLFQDIGDFNTSNGFVALRRELDPTR